MDYLKPPVLMPRSHFLKGLRYIDGRYGQYGWDLELCTQIRRAAKKILFLTAIGVTSNVEERPLPLSPGARGFLAADQALGAAVWAGKHYGWIHGSKFRLAATHRALGRLLGMRDAGCQFAQLSALLSGQKIDGSQRVLCGILWLTASAAPPAPVRRLHWRPVVAGRPGRSGRV